jgi:hypothetical protein
MKVRLINNEFEATQWAKDSGHPAVKTAKHYIHTIYDTYDSTEVVPGDWIVEMFDGVHVYHDEEFKELFT